VVRHINLSVQKELDKNKTRGRTIFYLFYLFFEWIAWWEKKMTLSAVLRILYILLVFEIIVSCPK